MIITLTLLTLKIFTGPTNIRIPGNQIKPCQCINRTLHRSCPTCHLNINIIWIFQCQYKYSLPGHWGCNHCFNLTQQDPKYGPDPDYPINIVITLSTLSSCGNGLVSTEWLDLLVAFTPGGGASSYITNIVVKRWSLINFIPDLSSSEKQITVGSLYKFTKLNYVQMERGVIPC